MLISAETFEELNLDALMEIYTEGNRENGEYFYPDETPEKQMELARRDCEAYLREDFFTRPGVCYWIWLEEGAYRSALRLEPWQDGLLLEALETHPDHRRKGFAKKLICAVLGQLDEGTKVYSHISKRNQASLASHYACGFHKQLDYSIDSDGAIYDHQVTMVVVV